MAGETPIPDAGTYDFVVVGGGSAGCVLANRLTEGGASVLLLEAGQWDRDPLIHIPIGIGKIFPQRLHDWGYFMEPDPGIDGRGIECARGRVIGGSSSINVMAYVRGHRSDYDRWARSGLDGWSYADVLPYFRRSENWEGGGDAYRGGEGPLRVQRTRYRDAILGDFIEAGRQAGYPVTTDYNGAQQEGFDYIQETIHAGRRNSAATAYLRPALRRKSLHVIVGARADRIEITDGRATGIRFTQGGRAQLAQARREVVLAAGVINSPKLLMLSGIGDPAHLGEHGIGVKIANPDVGANLRDHLSVMASYRRKSPSWFQQEMRYDRLAMAMLKSLLRKDGFASDVPIGVTAFLKTRRDLAAPDVQFLFLAAPFPARPYLPPFTSPVPDGFGCRVALLRPESAGSISLSSADPDAKPSITPNFLTSERDRDTLREGLRILRRTMDQPAMAPHIIQENAPGAAAQDDEALDAFIRATSVTVHHPAGTCRMGGAQDSRRVVDEQLRVAGVDGLRIVDASVMPDLVGGNINAVVMMIAEKAADLMLGRLALARADDMHRGTIAA
ncbi:GMC family oxidoreductase [Labrys sp. KNU-23]|uniref:GMC family oxidoreductase n=1 Tax=Labrys sp. KNU-23 TaxID=2789216 RepID=UPI001FED91FD|nr:GMC family oxidoreductase N-terminal domain-containing protein [Labrys sp. KNU-23]